MSTYRSPQPPRQPTVITMKRARATLAFTIVFVGLASIFVFAFSSRTTLECSRPAANCKVKTVHGPGLTSLDRTYPLASISRASVEKSATNDSQDVEGIALVVDGKPELLDTSSNIGHDGKVAWAKTVNDFLENPSRERLDIKHGSVWSAYLWCLVALGLIGLAFRAQTRVIIDKDGGVLVVEKIRLATNVETYPLKSVSIAEVHDDGDSRALRLLFVDGTTKNLTLYSDTNDAEKRRVAGAINVALVSESSDDPTPMTS